MKYLLLLCLTACSGPQAARVAVSYSVPAWAEPYVASWRAEFQVSGPLTMGWAEDLDPRWSGWEQGSIAYCRGDSLVVVKRSWWEGAEPEARLVTLWHELGHCWGGIKCHDLRRVQILDTKHYRSASIMYPEIDMTYPSWETHSEEYIDDMHRALADPKAYCSKEETTDASSAFSFFD